MSGLARLLAYHSSILTDMATLHLLRQQFRSLPHLSSSLSFAGQTILVTGANSGLGLEAARHFVALGAGRVILACRSTARGEAAKLDIEESTGRKGVAEVWDLDLADFDSVRSFCRRATRVLDRLDVVVLNAGVAVPEFEAAAGGFELQVAVNVVGTFLMGVMLLPKLRDTAGTGGNGHAHMVFVSSDGHHFAKFPERHEPSIFAAFKNPATMSDDRYNTTKLLVVLLLRELAARLSSSSFSVAAGTRARDSEVIVNAVTPGFCKSQISRNLPAGARLGVSAVLALIGRTAEVGARNLVAAAAAGQESHGQYIESCVVGQSSVFVRSEEGRETQKRAWEELMVVLDDIEPGLKGSLDW